MTATKAEILKTVAAWGERDGGAVFERKPDGTLKLRYSRPAVEPFTDFRGRLTCVAHVTVFAQS